MPPTYLPHDSSRDEVRAQLAWLCQRIARLEQDKRDLEVMLELATDHADTLCEELEQGRDDLDVMLEITADHGDDLYEELEQGRDDLEVMLEQTTNRVRAMEADLQHKAEEFKARNQFVRNTFGRYISDDVVAELLDHPDGLELGGEKRMVTILMSDLRGFTAVAERLDPQEVMRFLNRYLEAMVNVILSYQGTIIEILGDGLLVLFGAPISRDEDAERAVACALAMQLQMDGVNAQLRHDHLPEIEMGIGIHTGSVVVGNIGSAQRTKYGVVGSAVNLTGRVESYTTGSQILISPTTYAATAEILTIRHAFTVEPKGVPQPTTIYDVGGIGGAHQLVLPEPHEALSALAQEIPVHYRVMEGKFAGQAVYSGRFTKLSPRAAELHADAPVAALSNLKIQLTAPSGERIPGDLFAKVVGEEPGETTNRAVLRFTSVPPAVRAVLERLSCAMTTTRLTARCTCSPAHVTPQKLSQRRRRVDGVANPGSMSLRQAQED